MFVDYVMNNQGYGPVGEMLGGFRFDPGLARPFIDSRGQRCAMVMNNRGQREKRLLAELMAQGISSPVFNATTLRKEEWVKMDEVVLKAARQRLRAWSDLSAANSYGGFNGMSKTVLEYETVSDAGEAIVDMDGMTEGRNDAPRFQLEGLPLPITHSDFFFSSRQLATSRSSGTPLDTTMAEMAGRRVAEMIEKTLIGVETGITWGSAAAGTAGIPYGRAPAVYGYTNFPARMTKTDLTTPTGSNPEGVMTDVLEMRGQMYDNFYYGPYILYHSAPYDAYLDNDYFRTGSTAIHRTLRERIESIENIQAVRRLDYLTTGYVMILVQMTSNVARAVNGMDITTVQWESVGGMRVNFKVLAIQVPQLRADFNGRTGIVHATTS